MGAGAGRLADRLRILPVRLRYSRRLLRLFEWGAQWEQAVRRRPLLAAAERRAPSGREEVIYLTCLIGKDRAQDWGRVEALLARTVAALLAQDDRRWQLVICGQDRPATLPDDPRIHFLPFVARPEETRRFDKFYKYERLLAWLDAHGPETGYGFLLDADDVPSRALTGYILQDNNGTGYLVDQGYMLAEGRRAGRALGHRSLREGRLENNTLFRNCGSCVASFFDRRPGGWGTALLEGTLVPSHGRLPELARLMGVRFGWVPFPAICYMILHGENDHGGRVPPPRLGKARAERIEREFPGILAEG